jgi:hypothetical protein
MKKSSSKMLFKSLSKLSTMGGNLFWILEPAAPSGLKKRG